MAIELGNQNSKDALNFYYHEKRCEKVHNHKLDKYAMSSNFRCGFSGCCITADINFIEIIYMCKPCNFNICEQCYNDIEI